MEEGRGPSSDAYVVSLMMVLPHRAAGQSSCGRTALMLACLAGHEDAVAYLVEQNARADVADKERCTALMAASSKGHLGIVRLLLGSRSHGVNMTDAQGRSAVYHAAVNGHPEVVRALIVQGGACWWWSAEDGEEPVQAARRMGHTACVEVIKVSRAGEADALEPPRPAGLNDCDGAAGLPGRRRTRPMGGCLPSSRPTTTRRSQVSGGTCTAPAGGCNRR